MLRLSRTKFELTSTKPDEFSVLTGEEAFFHTTLGQGVDDGILASTHIQTATFARVRVAVLDDDRQTGLDE